MVNGQAITYTLDLAAPLVTVLAEAQLSKRTMYVYGLGDSPLAGDDGSAWVYLSGRDALNSVRQETDAAGQVTAARSFDPYGVVLSGDGGAPFGYTGEYRDSYIKLQWLRARWLSVELGRFVQPDTIRADFEVPATLNVYLYVGANPVKFIDPSGHSPTVDVGPGTTYYRWPIPGNPWGRFWAGVEYNIAQYLSGRPRGSYWSNQSHEYGYAVNACNSVSGDPRRKPPAAVKNIIIPVPVSGLPANLAQAEFSSAELGIMDEARSILSSDKMVDLASALESGSEAEVKIGSRPVVLVPDGDFSGFTLSGEQGFALGRRAFESGEELAHTVLQELYRLSMPSEVLGKEAFQSAATTETRNAFEFAERAFKYLFGGGQ